ncbi:MAG: alpha-amylase [Bacteroidetes bacterium]|nr:alpha-amylase [Bacteroidota bacterium]
MIQSCDQKSTSKNVDTSADSTVSTTESNDISWVDNAVIYEVNLRQYTPEGTIKAFMQHLDKIQDLGVDVLWFMPIHPIGVKNRKETEQSLGSYYSIRDYRGVNPDFGTKEDFKALVDKCHEMGFKVVLDWVANHSSWDHAWVTEHPEWYTADSYGNRPIVPIDNDGKATDWTDVADLNYENAEFRKAMIADMKYWVTDFDVDGFRCDVAGFVPVDFWVQARTELETVKPLFMLAEWEDAAYYEAFDFTYAWHQHHVMQEIIKGEQTVEDWKNLAKEAKTGWTGAPDSLKLWGPYNNQMNFITNHDENSWNKTVFDRFGNAHRCFATLSFTLPGLPLIYSGQEAAMSKVLRFFEKDTIDWSQDSLRGFYKALVELKHENSALNIGENGGEFKIISNQENDYNGLFVFERMSQSDTLVVVANLSNKNKTFKLETPYPRVRQLRFSSSSENTRLALKTPMKSYNNGLQPWECQVYEIVKAE